MSEEKKPLFGEMTDKPAPATPPAPAAPVAGSENLPAPAAPGNAEPKPSLEDRIAAIEAKLAKPAKAVLGDKLILRSDSHRGSVAAIANDDNAGVWIQCDAKNDKFPNSLIAIYDDVVQGPVIGFYRDTGEKDLAMTAAICLDDSGNPQIQVVTPDGKVGTLGLAELLNLVKPKWRTQG